MDKSELNTAILDILCPISEETQDRRGDYTPEGRAARLALFEHKAMAEIDFTAEGHAHLFEALLSTVEIQDAYAEAVRDILGVQIHPEPHMVGAGIRRYMLITAPAAVRAEAFLKVWKEVKK